ncbi:hypothetical protein [Streptomyces sp. NPDC017958]
MSTPVPTLKQLSDPATRTQLGEQSRRLAAGQTALEKVGPAAK